MIILTAECCILEDPDVIKNVEQVKIQDNKVVFFSPKHEAFIYHEFHFMLSWQPWYASFWPQQASGSSE